MILLERMRNCSLRTKFVFPVVVVITLAIGTLSSYLIERQAEAIRQELDTSSETMIRILAMHSESGVLFESTYELDEVLSMLKEFEDVTYAAIYNVDGKVLSETGQWDLDQIEWKKFTSHYDSLCRDYLIEDHAGRQYTEDNHHIVSRIENLDRENLGITAGLNSSLSRQYETKRIGTIKIIISLERVNQLIAQARMTTILVTLIVLGLAIAILMFFARLIIRPIKNLVEITDQVSRGDLSKKAEVCSNDELGHLASTFNRMIDSLNQSRTEIEEYNRDLEKMIIERTAALDEAQAQLIQTEKMSAIGQLAAGVAHELNNPLGGILGYAQFALEKMKKAQPDMVAEKQKQSFIRYLTDIETQAHRCKNIVQNLLRFSRSSRTTEFEQIDVNQILKDTVTFVEHQLHMSQIELSLDLNEDLPQIQGNAGQLQQVLTNLIINAMHASPPESSIEVASRYSPALGEFGGTVELVFTDHGHGIPPEIVKKIFEPFFTTKDVGKGTGLGLSVSYGIINEHGGEIKVTSEPGQGTTFTIVLPVQKSPDQSDNPDKSFAGGLTGRSER